MTDESFTKLLQKTDRAYNRYAELRDRAHSECERRYGDSPSNHDNDYWIDFLEGGCGSADETITAEKIEETAIQCGRERTK